MLENYNEAATLKHNPLVPWLKFSSYGNKKILLSMYKSLQFEIVAKYFYIIIRISLFAIIEGR